MVSFSDNLGKYLLLCIMSGCVPDLTVFTLKTIQVKSFGYNILKVRTTRTFILNVAKETLVTRLDADF